jgi:hypothetical protein
MRYPDVRPQRLRVAGLFLGAMTSGWVFGAAGAD